MKLAVILASGEDGYTVVECPTLPGCISQGKTHEEALANIKEAIAGWLEVELEKVADEAGKWRYLNQIVEV
jgi:predicted RNase H-like HicB family nuclease